MQREQSVGTSELRQPGLISPLSLLLPLADGLAYSALLKNELLGAGIEKVQDPQSEDRRLQQSTPAKRSLFSVKTVNMAVAFDIFVSWGVFPASPIIYFCCVCVVFCKCEEGSARRGWKHSLSIFSVTCQ